MTNTVKLTNGLRIANFNSPHPFNFTDGTVLPAVSPEMANQTKLTEVNTTSTQTRNDVEITLITPKFEMNDTVKELVQKWQDMYNNNEVDVVLVPLPMLLVLKDTGYDLLNSPFRGCKVDRVSKLVSINEFCI